MDFYMCLIMLTELMMIAMTLHVVAYSGFTRNQKTWYLLTFGAVMICAAAEFAVHGIPYDHKYAVLLTVVTVLQFSVAPMLGVFFSGALGLHRQKRVACIFFAANLIVETAAAPFGLIFRFTETEYTRGKYFIVYSIFYFISLIYLLVNMIIVGNRFRKRDVMTIVMILVILIAGILPMTFFKLNITYMAIAICASVCYIYYNDLVQQDIKTELIENQKKITTMQDHMISGLASVVESRDVYTGEHISRTSEYVKKLAEFARKDGIYADKLNDHFITLLFTLAPMHDIGKVVVPDRILKKPGRLTPEEFEEMKKHAAAGGAVVREVLSGVTDESYLSFASDIATYHHEKWNGTGYPEGLQGEQIPLSARIMAIADVFDALVSERYYKQPIPPDDAFKIIADEAGSHFDPLLAKVFLDHKEAFAVNSSDK